MSTPPLTLPSKESIARLWQFVVPIAALIFALVIHSIAAPLPDTVLGLLEIVIPVSAIVMLFPSVITALHHVEIIASRIGEPYGTLLLTLAVTTIEVSIIVSMMFHGENNPTLARESAFSVVMLVCSGGIGLCLTLGALKHNEQDHKTQGTSAYLAVLIVLSVLTLILPNFTQTTPGPIYSTGQMEFISALSTLLYFAFLYIQTVRHRSFFVDGVTASVDEATASSQLHKKHHSSTPLWIHLLCMFAGLAAVVLLTEQVADGTERGLIAIGVQRPDAIIGALIALLVLMPELLFALKAARHNELQRSINTLLGSALASIALTIPAVAVVSLATHRELILGLSGRDATLLVLTLSLCVVSFGTGRTNVLTGLVHLVIFAAYLLLLVTP